MSAVSSDALGTDIAHTLCTAHSSGIAGGRENAARADTGDRANVVPAVAAGITTRK